MKLQSKCCSQVAALLQDLMLNGGVVAASGYSVLCGRER